MKTKAIAQISLITGLLSLSLAGTACGADTLQNKNNSASPSFTMSTSTPELEAADQRVKQADAQLGRAGGHREGRTRAVVLIW